ncbi:MAG: DUF2283 domain-containing protein [Cyanobacteriota bacterium]|nr:DUF2283 domain-containing protein [Cyanobacteriota bacterium]
MWPHTRGQTPGDGAPGQQSSMLSLTSSSSSGRGSKPASAHSPPTCCAAHAMNICYFPDTDTLNIELADRASSISEAVNDNLIVDFDEGAKPVRLTLEHDSLIRETAAGSHFTPPTPPTTPPLAQC